MAVNFTNHKPEVSVPTPKPPQNIKEAATATSDQSLAVLGTSAPKAKVHWLPPPTAPVGVDGLKRARSALLALVPDCGYQEWFRIACAAKEAGLPFADFNEWSAGGGKYKGTANCVNLWKSIKVGKTNGVTKWTLLNLAQETAWIDPNPGGDFGAPGPAKHAPTDEQVAELTAKQIAITSALASAFASWPDAPADHGYLLSKKILPTGLKVVPTDSTATVAGQAVAGWLVVPCRDPQGKLTTVQYISPVLDEDKLSAPGAAYGDGMFVVGEILPIQPVYLCEGIGQAYACAGADHESAAVVTFGASRTRRVAKALRAWYPSALQIVIVADRGQEANAAKIAAEIDGAWIEMPIVKPDGAPTAKNYDANDYAHDCGIAALATLLLDLHKPVKPTKTTALPACEYPHVGPRGEILTRMENVMIALRNRVGDIPRLRFDETVSEIVVDDDGRSLTDNDYTVWQIEIEREGFKSHISPHMMRSAVEAVARESTFDSLKEWADSLQWDGIERVAAFAHKYLRVPDTPYARAVSCYLWSALAGRAIEPGCKADYVPVLVGGEGTRKTQTAETLAPDPRYFTSIDLLAKPDDLARKTRGVVVAEWAEMRGAKTRDEEAIKDFVTRREEHHVPKYREHAVRYKRRFIMIGTTNDLGVLPSYGDARRWLPLEIIAQIDIEAIEHDREQLWAEGVQLFKTGGVRWQEADTLAQEVRDDYREEDPLRDPVIDWLEQPPCGACGGAQGVTNGETDFALADLITGLQTKGFSRPQTNKLMMLLRSLGYEGFRTVKSGKKRSLWRKKSQ